MGNSALAPEDWDFRETGTVPEDEDDGDWDETQAEGYYQEYDEEEE